jgi:ankyrin repeat protein
MTIHFGDKNYVHTGVFSKILSQLEIHDLIQASTVCKIWRNHVLTEGCQNAYLRNAQIKYRHLYLIDLIQHVEDLNATSQFQRLIFTVICVRKLKCMSEMCLRYQLNCVLNERQFSPFDKNKYRSPEFQERIQFEAASFNYWVNNEEPYIRRKKIKHEFDINARNDNNNTPLMEKAERGEWRRCQVLLRNGAKVNVKNHVFLTPLRNAIFSGSLKTVKLLLDAGAEVNLTKTHNDISYALYWNFYKITKLLVDRVSSTANVDADLLKLLAYGQEDLIVSLLEKGMKFGRCPLLYEACKVNSFIIVEALGKVRANMNSDKDSRGFTALDIAAKFGLTDIVALMIRSGAKPTVLSCQLASHYWPGLTPLHKLLKNDFSHPKIHYFPSCRSAAARGDLKELEDDYKAGGREFNCLDVAASHDRVKIIQFLIQVGDDVNHIYKRGQTALIRAVINGRVRAAKLLVENGADITIKDAYKMSPLDYAKKYWPEKTDLIQLLRTKRRKKRK